MKADPHAPPARSRSGSGRSRRLLAAAALDALLVVAELVGGAVAHSTALAADAGHNLADVAALVLALLATKVAMRSPTAAHSFGFHRATVLSAAANVALLLAVTVGIVFAGITRLLHPGRVDAAPVIALAAAGLAINVLGALFLGPERHELSIRTALIHLAGDAASAGAVLAAGVVILVSGGNEAIDPAVSLGVALLVAVQAVRIGRESVDVLLEATPGDLDIGELAAAMQQVEGVSGVHDLHCWSLSSDVRALSAHVVVSGHPTLEQAQVIGDRVRVAVGAPFAIAHSTLELECEPCGGELSEACAIEVGQSAK